MICDLVEEQRLADLLGEMASFACPVHDLSLMFRLPVVASEAIRESLLRKYEPSGWSGYHGLLSAERCPRGMTIG
jgi:hypothetical protein